MTFRKGERFVWERSQESSRLVVKVGEELMRVLGTVERVDGGFGWCVEAGRSGLEKTLLRAEERVELEIYSWDWNLVCGGIGR